MYKRILLTGAAGLLGHYLRPELPKRWPIRSCDLRPSYKALPGEGTGSFAAGAAAPNAGYALEARAFVAYDPNTGVPTTDLARAG